MIPLPAWILAALVVTGAFLIFPFGCDGEYVLFDPVWYASGVDTYEANDLKSHHLLFHLAAMALAGVAETLGFERPGHVAVRALSGIGAATILLTLVALAGRRRWRVGVGLFLLLLATRAFFLEAFLGENVLPASAAVLLALVAASKEGVSLRCVGLLTIHALLWRQDAILALPAILLALFWRLPSENRVLRLVIWTGLCGVVTLGCYVVVGLTVNPGSELAGIDGSLERLKAWMWGIADKNHALEQDKLTAHAVSYGESITGQQFPSHLVELHIWIGVAFMTLLAAFGVWFRGDGRWERLAAAAGLTALIRFAFYTWFEPGNEEWTLLTWTLVAGVAAAAAHGKPRSRPATRVMAGVVLFVIGLAVWRSHGDSTLTFRDDRYERASAVVKEHWKPGYRVYGFQNKAYFAIAQRGITPTGHLPTHFDDAKPLIRSAVARDRVPTLVMMDLRIQTGMPEHIRALRHEWRGKITDDPPYARVLWCSDPDDRHGIYVVGFLIPE